MMSGLTNFSISSVPSGWPHLFGEVFAGQVSAKVSVVIVAGQYLSFTVDWDLEFGCTVEQSIQLATAIKTCGELPVGSVALQERSSEFQSAAKLIKFQLGPDLPTFLLVVPSIVFVEIWLWHDGSFGTIFLRMSRDDAVKFSESIIRLIELGIPEYNMSLGG